MHSSHTVLVERGVLAVAGEDRKSFLQGLVSNDVNRVAAVDGSGGGPGGRAIYAALLTAQGKFLHDFFIAEQGDGLLLETERGRLADLKRRLSIYKLRAKVTVEDVSQRFDVAVAWGSGVTEQLDMPSDAGAARLFAGGIAVVDPRLSALGVRVLLPAGTAAQTLAGNGLPAAAFDDYDRLRLGLGVPDGSRDLVVDKSILLESGFDELNGVDWKKGCYMGQELTARTKYRGLVKKRLVPVAIEGDVPPAGTLLMLGDKEAGEMRSGLATGGLGLALLRLEAMTELAAGGGGLWLTAGSARLTPMRPDWARF